MKILNRYNKHLAMIINERIECPVCGTQFVVECEKDLFFTRPVERLSGKKMLVYSLQCPNCNYGIEIEK